MMIGIFIIRVSGTKLAGAVGVNELFSRRIELLEDEMRTELSKTVGFGDDALGKILTNLTMSIILPIVLRALFEPPPGWHTFGTHVDTSTLLEFSNITDETGLPLWERPAE